MLIRDEEWNTKSERYKLALLKDAVNGLSDMIDRIHSALAATSPAGMSDPTLALKALHERIAALETETRQP